MVHGEKLDTTNKLILIDGTGKAFSAGDIGEILLSGPKLYLNDGTSWKLITSA